MKTALTIVAALAISLALGGLSAAKTTVWVVDDDGADCPRADFSAIQAAVDRAAPGDTILVCAGTYHERVKIEKNDLTLRAKGTPEEVVVDADDLGNGLWINAASGVTIEGFTVREGHDNDIFLTGANGNTIRRNIVTLAHHDGIELFDSDNNLVEHNVSVDNLARNACGINLTAGADHNLVRHNIVRNNEWGIQIAGSNDNVIFDNEAVGNRGNGIRNLAGSSRTVIDGNRVFDNGRTPGPLTGATNGGIRLVTGADLVVMRNHAFGNLAVDIREEAAAATFENNHCDTSVPPGLCDHEGRGH